MKYVFIIKMPGDKWQVAYGNHPDPKRAKVVETGLSAGVALSLAMKLSARMGAELVTYEKGTGSRYQMVARGTNPRGRIEEFDLNLPTTHKFMSDVIKGITENMEEVAKNRELMSNRVASRFCERVGMNVHFGERGLDKTWQAEFEPQTICVHCGMPAEIAFVGLEDDFAAVSSLHENEGEEGGFWPHDSIAAAVYICPYCFKATAEFNQA